MAVPWPEFKVEALEHKAGVLTTYPLLSALPSLTHERRIS
jgi:hypothetical protein